MEAEIRHARDAYHRIEEVYIAGMTELLKQTTDDLRTEITHYRLYISDICVGAAENPRKVKWSVGTHILIAMIITMPVTMLISAVLYLIISPLIGV